MKDTSGYIQQMFKYGSYLNQLVTDGRLTREKLGRSIDLQLETVMLLQILGEAARKLRDRGEELGHGVDLRPVAGMRNIISHNYDGVDWNVVEETVFEDIPVLLEGLEKVLDERNIARVYVNNEAPLT